MASGLLARSRVLTACLCLAAVMSLGIGGCGTTGSSAVTVSGQRLTVYLSAPANLRATDPEARDVIDAELLAFHPGCTLGSCAPIHIGNFTVYLVRLIGDKLSSDARTAISDTTTAVAYLGEIVPGTSADSVGITNAQDLLQVSPTDSAPAPQSEFESFSTYGRTFARMVGTVSNEATALVGAMKSAGVTSVYVQNDGSSYGRAIAQAVSADAGSMVAKSASSAAAVFYGGADQAKAKAAFDSAASANPTVKLFAPSALDDDAFASGLSPAAQGDLYVSAPGFTPSSLPPAGQLFVTSFKSAFGHAPSSLAIFGYAAMKAVLGALSTAGSGATNRTTVVQALLDGKTHNSVLGTISISKGGDITIKSPTGTSPPPFVLLRVRAGKLVQHP